MAPGYPSGRRSVEGARNMMSNATTLRALERNGAFVGSGDSLDEWYASVRDTPLDVLSVGDLARAIRQKLFLETVVSVALARLLTDPCAGDLYDGELLVSLRNVPADLWASRTDLREGVASVLAKLDTSCLDSESARDIEAIRKHSGLR
jgi:hypothetical protein